MIHNLDNSERRWRERTQLQSILYAIQLENLSDIIDVQDIVEGVETDNQISDLNHK